MKSCALTGHRELSEEFDVSRLYEKLEELIKDGYDTFFCGMAEGFDLIALDCLVGLKRKYRIYIEACIPFAGQEARYSLPQKQKYGELLLWCDRKTVLFPSYRNGCYLIRDRYMVDCADAVLAYLVRESGGTAYTVNYAKKKEKPVYYFRA